MASYALQQLAFLLPLCTFDSNWVTEKKHHEALCLSFIDNSNNFIALEIAYYCWAIRSGPQSAFQFIPNVQWGSGLVLCGSVKFFPNRDNQIYIQISHCAQEKIHFSSVTVKSEVQNVIACVSIKIWLYCNY